MTKVLYCLIFFFLFSSKLFSQNLTNFEIIGNERISDETIIIFTGLNDIKNKKLNDNDLNNIIKNLYSTDFFENVSIKIINGKLLIKVLEYPLIQKVELSGIKNKKEISIIKESIKLKAKNSFIPIKVKNDETIINNILRVNGYFFSTVSTEITTNENNTVDIIYNINRGDKAYIRNIKFIGDKKIKSKKLKKIILTEEAKFWKFLTKNKFLNINRIDLDKKILINFYKNRGFYNVSIESSSARIINESDFQLIFSINAGERFFFNDFKLKLPNNFDKKNFEHLYKMFKKYKNKKYSLNTINELIEETDDVILSKEFQFSKASYDEKIIDNNKINITISIEETEKFFVNKINIFGNYITEESVIRNKILTDEGDPYNEILFEKSLNNIKNSGMFSNVKKTIIEDDENNKIINILLEEQPSGSIMIGAGTGSSGFSTMFGLEEKNYLGKGINLKANLEITSDTVNFLLDSTNPNYNNSNRSLSYSFENTSKDAMSSSGFKSNKTGFNIASKFEQYEDIYFHPKLSLYYEDIETNDNASTAYKKQEGTYFENEFSYSLTLNKFNQRYLPTDGYKAIFFQSLPIYTDDYTVSNMFEITKHSTIAENAIFSSSFFAKSVNSLNGNDVRITKRVFLPKRKLRGFRPAKIGPKDGTDYIGGNYGLALNFATTLPNTFNSFENVDLSLFYDAANVWGVDYNSDIDSNKIRSSTGVAIDWLTPVGPLTFSLSKAITKASSDETETFRFDIGTTF